jgi:hypothetical protein
MSVLNFCLAFMHLLENTKYVVEYSGFKDKKDKGTDFPQVVTRILPESCLHFDLFTVDCTSFPVPVN